MAHSSVSDVRIVLLGKSVSENSRVGNFLLGRSAFDSEVSPDVVERVGGRLKDRHVIIINSPQLLQMNISDRQLSQRVRECVNLSDPGPHVFILVLQYEDFTEEDMRRVKCGLEKFSEEAIKRTILLTTDEEKVNESIRCLTFECGGGHLQFDDKMEEWCSMILQHFEKILTENSEEFHTRDLYNYAKDSSEDRDQSRSCVSLRAEEEDEDPDEHQETRTEKKEGKHFLQRLPVIGYWSQKHDQPKRDASVTRKQKLNLVLCGSVETLKASTYKLLRGEIKHQINLVELPALNHLSGDKLMSLTLHCVSLCHPGVHAFLFVIPDSTLNNEDKAEIDKIQRIFSSRINKHFMILIFREKKWNIFHTSSNDTSIQIFESQPFVLEKSSQVPALLRVVEDMVERNEGSCYTTFMYLQAQIELERNKHRAEMEELRKSMMKTQSTAGVADNDGMRIVLLGKTGVGKSATGNTILRREAFLSIVDPSSVTRECQKETSEINRRKITVIDTPGLFDTGVDNVETKKEIVKCVSMAAPGPHVFLLVIQVGRFTQEEKDAVKVIQETFGDKSRMYTMVLFTRGDDLRGSRVENFIERDGSLKNLIQQCGKRYHVFNNNETENQKQVSELLDKIDCMVAANGGSSYTNEMFQEVEKNIKEEQERIMKEKEEEIKRKEEELKAKYEAETEQLKKEIERERQEIQNEMQKKEEDIKKKEEEIKKETDENARKELQRKLEEQQKQFEDQNKRKEKDLEEQQQNVVKYLEEKHEKEKQNLQEKIQRETREQAEREYQLKVAKALEEAEEKLPFSAKLARNWDRTVPFVGGAAGGLYGSIKDWQMRNSKPN